MNRSGTRAGARRSRKESVASLSDPTLRFVVALQAEARPLVDRFGLEPLPESHAFHIYRGERGWAIVAGLGKAASAAATAYLHLLSGGEPGQVWLNVGIGGHSQRDVGGAFIAHKIQDAASGLAWYPPLVVDPPCPTAPFLTVERVEEEYAPLWVHEMEAAGFYPTACRFSTSELVHSFRVISDNPEATLARAPSASFVEGLIRQNLDPIESFGTALLALARELFVLAADPPGYREILARWPFSLAEQRRLRRLLQRLAVLAPGDAVLPLTPPDRPGPPERGRDILWALEARLAEIPIAIGPAGAPSHAVR
jgi:nucleoside phosphorylase